MKKKIYEAPDIEETEIDIDDIILVSAIEGEDEEAMSKDFIVW